MTSLGSFMFILFLSFYVTNCEDITHNYDEQKINAMIDLGLNHVESEHTKRYTTMLLEKVYREQPGLWNEKYTILVLIAPTNCDKDDVDEPFCLPYANKQSMCKIDYLVTPYVTDNVTYLQSRPIPDYTRITANNCTKSQQYPQDAIARPLPRDDPVVLDLIAESLSALNTMTIDENISILNKSLSATEEFVHGVGKLWKINATIILSDCKKNDSKDPIECEPLNVPENFPQRCLFEIMEPSNSKHFGTVNVTCQGEGRYSFARQRPANGSLRHVSTDDPKVKKTLEACLSILDVQSLYDNKYRITEVSHSYKSVVIGKGEELYQIKARIIESRCPKDSDICDKNPENEDTLRSCYFKVSSQPWIPKLNVTINCRKPGMIPHPPDTDLDPESPNVQRLVAESLQRFNAATKFKNLYIPEKALDAHKEAGRGKGNFIWTITASIILSNCVKRPRERSNLENNDLCGPLPFENSQICTFTINESATGIGKIQWKCAK